MKVYLLEYSYDDYDSSLAGIYSTEEKAEKAAKKIIDSHPNFQYKITEHLVDQYE